MWLPVHPINILSTFRSYGAGISSPVASYKHLTPTESLSFGELSGEILRPFPQLKPVVEKLRRFDPDSEPFGNLQLFSTLIGSVRLFFCEKLRPFSCVDRNVPQMLN